MGLTAKITRIFAPTDFSSGAEGACLLAARLANFLKAEIVLFHAISGMDFLEEVGRARGMPQEEVVEAVRDRVQSWFETIIAPSLGRFLPVEVMVSVGEPSAAIVPAAKGSNADLILMATHGRTGLAHVLLGSVTETVLRSVPVPVLALRLGRGERLPTAVDRILWATDLSPVSEGAWRYALTLADAFAAEVILLHVVRPEELPWLGDQPITVQGSWLQRHLAPLDRKLERRQRVAEALGLGARRKIRVGTPAEAIVAEAQEEEADLVVLGTHGRTGLPHVLLGSVAEEVIRKAPCPVLAVRVKPDGKARKRVIDRSAA